MIKNFVTEEQFIEFKNFIYNEHDVETNHKYDKKLPYSFHLEATLNQGLKFKYLIDNLEIKNFNEEMEDMPDFLSNETDFQLTDFMIVKFALVAHDATEDIRMTYNDLIFHINRIVKNYEFAKFVADIVYCVQDEKGKNRTERKNEKYWKELLENIFAIFVKLCDIASNALYGKLTSYNKNSMFEKNKKEWTFKRSKLYKKEFNDLLIYIDRIFI